MKNIRRMELMRGLRQAINGRLRRRKMTIRHLAAVTRLKGEEVWDFLRKPLKDLTVDQEVLQSLLNAGNRGPEFWDRHTIRLFKHVGGFHESYR